MAKGYIQNGIALETLLRTGTNMPQEGILLVEKIYQNDPAKGERFVRKIKSLQALSFFRSY
jgi:hypothetical protein